MQVDIERKNNGSVPITEDEGNETERRKMSAKFPQGGKQKEEPIMSVPGENRVKVHQKVPSS